MATFSVVEHQFGGGQTVEAVVRLVNAQNMTQPMLTKLMTDYNTINGTQVPRVGDVVLVPVFVGFLGMNANYEVKTIEV